MKTAKLYTRKINCHNYKKSVGVKGRAGAAHPVLPPGFNPYNADGVVAQWFYVEDLIPDRCDDRGHLSFRRIIGIPSRLREGDIFGLREIPANYQPPRAYFTDFIIVDADGKEDWKIRHCGDHVEIGE